jgi:hypothetical protein
VSSARIGFNFGYFADVGCDATENYASLDVLSAKCVVRMYSVEIQRRDMDQGD